MQSTDASLAELRGFLQKQAIPFTENEPLHTYTSFRLGGNAEVFITPQTAEQLAELQAWLLKVPVPVFLLGGGSNLLISDDGFRGAVVHPALGEELQILEQSGDRLKVFVPASARAPLTGKKISALGFTGLEFLTTIPGQFGGSIIQNAGCYGHELKDSLADVRVARDGNLVTVGNADCAFQYRDSAFKRDSAQWVAGATLELSAGDPKKIGAHIADYKARRIASQPKNRRSAGSIFKNPKPGISAVVQEATGQWDKKAWQLIELAGLRGVTDGGAEISAEHCNFIVNNGDATAAQVYRLIQLAEKRVFETTGVRLEREVVLVGF